MYMAVVLRSSRLDNLLDFDGDTFVEETSLLSSSAGGSSGCCPGGGEEGRNGGSMAHSLIQFRS
jgi:hypothetical protein